MNLIEQTNVREQVVKGLGLEGLSTEYQNEILKDLEDTISQRLLLEVHAKLSQEEIKKFETKSSLATDEEAYEYLQEKIPNIDSLATQIANRVVEEFKQNASEDSEPDDMVDDIDEEEDDF